MYLILGNRRITVGVTKVDYEYQDLLTSEVPLRITENFYLPVTVGIRTIKEYVPQALNGIAHLMIAEDEVGRAVAFMGIEDGTLEMLFISPEERGKGLGKRLIQYGIENYSVERLAVNEQNPQAKGFLRTHGLSCLQEDRPRFVR